MAAEHERANIFDAHARLLRDEGAIARRVKGAGHADHAVLRESRRLQGDVAHRVERIRDDDQDRVGRALG